MPLLEQLHYLDTNWIIDPSHSFIENNRMRLQVTFPDLSLNDGKSDISLSLFLHNSYDGSEGVRLIWGLYEKSALTVWCSVHCLVCTIADTHPDLT